MKLGKLMNVVFHKPVRYLVVRIPEPFWLAATRRIKTNEILFTVITKKIKNNFTVRKKLGN